MRDPALLLIFAGLIGAALFRPWLGVVALAILSHLHPQSWGEGLVSVLPVYAALFAATTLSAAYAVWRRPAEVQWPAPDWRLWLLGLLWIYFLFTTLHARAYFSAWDKFAELSKIFASILLMLTLINTREKLFFLTAAIALAVGLVAVKGGYWAVTSGFSDRVMGPPRSEFSDNNHFAIAAIMTISLLALWRRQSANRVLRYLLLGVTGLCILAAIASWSRGALVSLTVVLLLTILFSRRRLLALSLLAALLLVALGSLPDGWFDRMETIGTYQQDQSAQNRLAVWQRGIDYALAHPWTGAGFRGWRYVAIGVGRIDWHSAYVQVLAEHGVVAFGLWCGLVFGSILALLRAALSPRIASVAPWMRDYGAALGTALVGYAIGSAFLSIAYWQSLFQLIFMGALARRLARPVPAVEPHAAPGTLYRAWLRLAPVPKGDPWGRRGLKERVRQL